MVYEIKNIGYFLDIINNCTTNTNVFVLMLYTLNIFTYTDPVITEIYKNIEKRKMPQVLNLHLLLFFIGSTCMEKDKAEDLERI